MSKHTAWAAGFFEGEGFVYIGRQRPADRINTRYRLIVGITNTERILLEVFSKYWGGNVRPRKPTGLSRKPLFAWALCGQQAERFLAQILPHLRGKKKNKACLAIEFQQRIRPDKRKRTSRGTIAPIDKKEISWREATLLKIRE